MDAQELLAALSALVQSAPAAPRVASPFASAVRITDGKGAVLDSTPEPLRDLDRKDRKATAAVLAIPGWSCTVDATYEVPGEDEPRIGALHGYSFARKPGEPCPGVSGMPKGQSCTGTVRA